ncbi:uncharacterized protein CCOS01_08597 [Colletotrichum costaricense]|uniref:Uncharacterized protein n=1 Tax=Colletotrichum costaricense TaxID=1209916 RepID=A0AAJ0E0I8_9PEZI|nr:uncharacterized protein CCOS01_08597 [Colletotrichum costaricense]KAK1526179.1 hypothetical protein CCOS01_08597 [Colletotrichum costaricense]
MNYILARSCPCLLHTCTPANDPIVGTYIPIPYQTCLPTSSLLKPRGTCISCIPWATSNVSSSPLFREGYLSSPS